MNFPTRNLSRLNAKRDRLVFCNSADTVSFLVDHERLPVVFESLNLTRFGIAKNDPQNLVVVRIEDSAGFANLCSVLKIVSRHNNHMHAEPPPASFLKVRP